MFINALLLQQLINEDRKDTFNLLFFLSKYPSLLVFTPNIKDMLIDVDKLRNPGKISPKSPNLFLLLQALPGKRLN